MRWIINNRHVFLTVLELGYESKMPGVMCGEHRLSAGQKGLGRQLLAAPLQERLTWRLCDFITMPMP